MQTFEIIDSNWQEENNESIYKKKLSLAIAKILHPFVWGKMIKIFQMMKGEGGGRGR